MPKTTEGQRKSGAMRYAFEGLTQRQRTLCKLHLPDRGCDRQGWSLYREPSVGNPPTTLRLIRRNAFGKAVEVISITENGVTK